jgi:hypothetical protein
MGYRLWQRRGRLLRRSSRRCAKSRVPHWHWHCTRPMALNLPPPSPSICHTSAPHHLNNDGNEEKEDDGDDSDRDHHPGRPQSHAGARPTFSTNGLERRNQRQRAWRTATNTTKATWRVATGDGVVNGGRVVEISPSKPPQSPPSRNSMTRQIWTTKTMGWTMGTSEMTSSLASLKVGY